MKWVVKHFIPLGGNPHRQMDLYPPLGGWKPGVVALIIPPGVDYAIALDEGSYGLRNCRIWWSGLCGYIPQLLWHEATVYFEAPSLKIDSRLHWGEKPDVGIHFVSWRAVTS